MIIMILSFLSVDAVLVLDHERLYIDFQRDLPKETAIVRLPKSGGVSITYLRHIFTRYQFFAYRQLLEVVSFVSIIEMKLYENISMERKDFTHTFLSRLKFHFLKSQSTRLEV